MKQIKSLLSVFVLTLAATACAGNSGENKKSNEPTKEDNKMEVVALNKADFLKKVYNYEANPNDWKFEGFVLFDVGQLTLKYVYENESFFNVCIAVLMFDGNKGAGFGGEL